MTSLPIELPEAYIPLVVENQTVTVGQLLAQKTGPVEERVNIPQLFGISVTKAKAIVKKNPGDIIQKGDIVAQTSNIFGKKKRTLISEVNGTVTRYERNTGDLIVFTDQTEEKGRLISPVAGVVGLCNNKEIVINTDNALNTNGVAFGSNNTGKLFILEESFVHQSNMLYRLDSSADEKIVVVKELTRDLFIKGKSIGVKGFLTVDLANEDIEYLVQKNTTISVLEISSDLLPTLREWNEKTVTINTQLKAIIRI